LSLAYTIEGFVLTSLGRHTEAREAYHRGVQLNAGDYLARYFGAVDLDRDAGRDVEKLSLLDQTIKINPHFALAHFEIGKLCYHSGAFDRARGALQRATEIDPGLEQGHYLLGKVYQAHGKY
jgi:tetratricopeptide (TPR) repeat protein